MGQFHFDVPSTASEFVKQSLWKDAYITGIEGIPWQSTSQFDGSRLTITRSIESSGKLSIACPIEGLGYRTLATCSLRPLSEPHLLPLELARGSCYRARIQSDVWQRAGLTLSQKFVDLMQEGTERFLDATLQRADVNASSEASLEAIRILEEAILDLGESYAVQSISFRKQREPRIGTLLAGTVIPPSPDPSTSGPQFRDAFNAAAVRLSWADIETDAGRFDYEQSEQTVNWCTTNGVRVIGGPLLDFREKLMPHWLYLLEDNFDEFLDTVINFVEKTVMKFRGSIQLWNCAAGLNTPGPLNLDDEQIMRLALGVLQSVRRLDPNTPAIITFDQPYGEYLAKCRDGISPMHFADALARSGLGIAGLGLDVRMNYTTGATLPRSAVDFGLMIDRWATLGMPLLVQLGMPGGVDNDPVAIAPSEVLKSPTMCANPSSEQLRMAAPLIRTLLAKHTVHGIVWDGWSDMERHVMSHSGLIDAKGQPRPMLEYLTRVRREFLA
ncbi:MAG: endo-1,4-beta-xylanase [Pirellulaceae bacterium]